MLSFRETLDTIRKEVRQSEEKPLMGWTCTYLPLEILEAAGFEPYRILPEPTSEQADGYLDPNFCPLIKTSLGKALAGGYSFLSGIVVLNTCDGMRRFYDAWRYYVPTPFFHLVDLPRIITPDSVVHFREGLQALIEDISRHFGLTIPEHGLTQAVKEANSTRSLMRRVLFFQGRGNPPLRHGDIVDILAARWWCSREIFNMALRGFLNQLDGLRAAHSQGIKIIVTGSLLDGSTLIRTVEGLGGEVVVSDLCTGGRFLDEVVLSSDPLGSLSEFYLMKIPCARMFDTERRISYIEGELTRTKARGVIYFTLKFCDPYLYEAPVLEEALKRKGIPALFLEGEYTGRVGGGTRTRVQAFLEMLERDGA